MIAYLDSSVVLRVILRQPDALEEWREIETGVASALVEVECLRTLDRLRLSGGIGEEDLALRLSGGIGEEDLALRREAVFRIVEALEVVEATRPVLVRASQPLPTSLGTLDAIHLATALLWREHRGRDLVMTTHDGALGRAARALGMRVLGVVE